MTEQKRQVCKCGKKLAERTLRYHKQHPNRCERVKTSLQKKPTIKKIEKLNDVSLINREMYNGYSPFKTLPFIDDIERVDLNKLKIITTNMDKLEKSIFIDSRHALDKKGVVDTNKKNAHIKSINRWYRIAREYKGLIPVSRTQNDGIGRYRAMKGMSLANITRRVRKTIAHEYYQDVDMVSSQPNILLNYCEKFNIPCESLRHFNKNREDIFKSAIECGLAKDRNHAKTSVFIGALNSAPNHLRLNRGEKYDFPFYYNFFNEIQNIHNEILKLESALVKIVKNKGLQNLGGRTCSLLLSCLENDCLMVMRDTFDRAGKCPECLIYDGFLVPKMDLDVLTPLLRQAEGDVKHHLDINIKLVAKPLDDDILDLSCCEDKDYIDDNDKFFSLNRNKRLTDEEQLWLDNEKKIRANNVIRELYNIDKKYKPIIRKDRYVNAKDLNCSEKGCVIKAGLSMGKTLSTEKHWDNTLYEFITILTPRVLYAKGTESRFNNRVCVSCNSKRELGENCECGQKKPKYEYVFSSYLGRKEKQIWESYAIVQAESMNNIVCPEKRVGLLVLDECESFFTQLTSVETHGRNHTENINAFLSLVKSAKKVICMDAFITNRTLNGIN